MSRVRYQHGFPWDLFISYSHVDNAESEKWVEAFETRLQKRLDESTGKEIRIWRDARALGPGAVLDPAVMHAVQNSAIFLMILSRSWSASDWCPREYEVFQTTGKLHVNNRSRVVPVERYPVDHYPHGVAETLSARFFRTVNGTAEHLIVNETETRDDPFEDLFTSLTGSLEATLRELELNPVRRPGPQEGAVWFEPAPSLPEKLDLLKSQVLQAGFQVAANPSAAKVEVRLVGPGEPRHNTVTQSERPRLVYVDPQATEDGGLGQQMVRELAGYYGLEVLTDWTEYQDRLAYWLKRPSPNSASAPTRQGVNVYFLHEEPDGARAGELSGHLSRAGCVVQPQMARGARERTNQNRFWMGRSDAILVLLGKCSPDWAAIQFRQMVEFAPTGKQKILFLDDPESSYKNILRLRTDVDVLDAIRHRDALALFGQVLSRLPERTV